GGTVYYAGGYVAPYYVPYYYPCPMGMTTVMRGAGAMVYSCPVTPMISTTVPLTAMMMASKKMQAESAQVTSSPVVMYQVASDTVVYATSYKPAGVYWENERGRQYWVPGPSSGSSEVKDDIRRAAAMQTPTANATVITYTISGQTVYLTDQSPLHGIYSQKAGALYAWIPGVSKPSSSQR